MDSGRRAVDVTASAVSSGVLWLHRAEDGAVSIYDLAVDEAMRGRGLGRQVMQVAKTRSRELGATAMKLHVFGDNAVARRLYQSLGHRGTNVMMAKSLIEPETDGMTSPR